MFNMPRMNVRYLMQKRIEKESDQMCTAFRFSFKNSLSLKFDLSLDQFICDNWPYTKLRHMCSTFAALISRFQDLNWRIYYLFYGALHRTIFALAVAWLLYACHIGYGGFINKFLSWKLFLPLSALCYSVSSVCRYDDTQTSEFYLFVLWC